MAQQRVTPQQIAALAAARGYDPQAVLAVASREGLGGGIGDGGHAYGPFQLNNAGGAITQQYGGHVNDPQVQNWAWSPQGVSFALDRMGFAKGLKGADAISAIVNRFERPANPGAEIAGAVGAYGGLSGAAATPPGAGVPSPAGMTSPLAGAAAPPPPPNFQPRLAAALAGARQSPTNDLTGFYSTLRQALQARDRAVLPSPQQVHQAGVVSGGRLADAANPSVIARRGQVGGNTKGENPGFLNSLAELAAFEHAPVEINSGYRSTAKQAQLYANRASNPNPVAPPGHSLHEQGLAADGTVGGKPLGTLPPALLARYGLMPVPGDPVHVQVRR